MKAGLPTSRSSSELLARLERPLRWLCALRWERRLITLPRSSSFS